MLLEKLDRSNVILDVIEKNPGIRFNEIMRITDIRNGTLSHYVKKLEKEGSIVPHRTPRVTRLYPKGISESQAKVCKYLTIPTQRNLITFLIKKEIATSIEIREFMKKSPSVISVNLKELYKAKIINKRYDIPSNKFSLRNPEQINGIMNEYYPKYINKISENTIEMLDF